MEALPTHAPHLTSHSQSTTPTQPSAAPSVAGQRPPRALRRSAVPAFLLACSCVLIGGSLLGVGGCSGAAERPAARAGMVVAAHSRAASRFAAAADANRGGVAPGSPSIAAAAPAVASASPSASPPAANASASVGAASRTPSANPARPSAPSANADFDAPLRIKRLVLARDVEAREPVAASATFAPGEADRIYAFVEVENPERAESEIVVTFEPAGGEATGHVRLRVGPSSRWRTWAFTRGARSPGQWEAVVRGANGDVLARAPFAIES